MIARRLLRVIARRRRPSPSGRGPSPAQPAAGPAQPAPRRASAEPRAACSAGGPVRGEPVQLKGGCRGGRLGPFVANRYNLLDAVIIALSLAALGPLDVPASVLRVARAFRVARLFGRLRPLRNIIAGVAASAVAVLSSFALLLLVVCICEL